MSPWRTCRETNTHCSPTLGGMNALSRSRTRPRGSPRGSRSSDLRKRPTRSHKILQRRVGLGWASCPPSFSSMSLISSSIEGTTSTGVDGGSSASRAPAVATSICVSSGTAGAPRSTVECDRHLVQSLVACAWPHLRQEAIHSSLVCPKGCRSSPYVPSDNSVPTPQYSHITLWPRIVTKLGTGLVITMPTTRVPVRRCSRYWQHTFSI